MNHAPPPPGRNVDEHLAPTAAALRASGVTVRFGGLTAVDRLDLEVKPDSIHALIGPNGAGKSTAVDALSGFRRPTEGTISIGAHAAQSWSSHSAAKAGLARTFQKIRLFGVMTVLETILVGRHTGFSGGMLAALGRTAAARRDEEEAVAKAKRLIEFVGLPANVAEAPANALPYGHQRRVEIARALVSDPKVLLLDEPLAGMNAAEKLDLSALIRSVSAQGVGILLIEHDMDVIRNLADHATVLYHGQKLVDGTPDEVLSHEQVQAAYLGKAKP